MFVFMFGMLEGGGDVIIEFWGWRLGYDYWGWI